MQERLIRMLEAIASSGEPVSVADIASMTGVPRASVYRNIASLLECGFIDEAEGGNGYVLGLRFVRIALTGKADSHVISAAGPMLKSAVKALGETAFLARYRGGRVDLIHVEIPSDPTVSYIYPGLGPRPAHACSSAKAIAAFIRPDMRDDLLETNPIRYNAATIVEPEKIARELNQVRRYGYAICDGEIDEGVTSIAVPINVDRLGAIFSMGVVGPSHRIKPVVQNRILPVLTDEAVRVAAAIQHCSIVEAESVNTQMMTEMRENTDTTH